MYIVRTNPYEDCMICISPDNTKSGLYYTDADPV